jgi:glucuronide carrier protein
MTLRRIQYPGYGAGDAANNLTFSLVSAFLLIYYTDVAGISAAAAGTLFLVVRVWGGIADLIAGRVVDATNTRWGKFRPYLLFASIPLMLLNVAVFSIPSDFSSGAKLAFAYASYIAFQLAYSFVNIPYGSLSAAMTQIPDERAKLSTSRTIFTTLTVLLIAAVVSPQISAGGNLQRSLTTTTVTFAVVGFGLYLFCFFTSRETVQRSADKATFGAILRMLGRNRPLLLLCAASLLFLGGQFSLQTVAVYYARDVLGDANVYIVLTVVSTVFQIGASLAVPKRAERWGKKRCYLVGAVIAAASGVGVAVAPGSVPVVGIACYGVLGFGLGMINVLIFAMQPDTVDYGEWKSGIRAEGSSYSVLSFTRKAGQGVGGGLAAYTIGLGGYVSGAATQTSSALTSIRVAAGIIPAAAVLAAGAVMLAYPLTEKRLREIVEETAERRALTPSSPRAQQGG